MWAVGIIMHEVLTCGEHPLYRSGDSSVKFKQKLKNSESLEPTQTFSWIAKNLFSRLTMRKNHQRYSAEDALQHPWITREKTNQVPQTLQENMNTVLFENSLKRKMLVAFFLSYMKVQQEAREVDCDPRQIMTSVQLSEYKTKVERV